MIHFFKKLSDYGLSPNQYYVLYCIRHGLEAKNVNLNLEMRILRTMNYLDKKHALTEAGVALLEEMDGVSKSKAVKKEIKVDVDWIDKYLELWPTVKLPSGKYARCAKKNLEAAFKWFFANHKYSWETIISATEMYVEEYEAQNYKYMRTSQYFIKKSDTDKSVNSELANYCALVESGVTETAPFVFKEKVFGDDQD